MSGAAAARSSSAHIHHEVGNGEAGGREWAVFGDWVGRAKQTVSTTSLRTTKPLLTSRRPSPPSYTTPPFRVIPSTPTTPTPPIHNLALPTYTPLIPHRTLQTR
jgi:hypothetical protein